MPKKLSEKGSVVLILIPLLVVGISVAAFLVYKTITVANKKLSLQSEVLAVELKKEYDNPFDPSVQYGNPFSKQNPFDAMK